MKIKEIARITETMPVALKEGGGVDHFQHLNDYQYKIICTQNTFILVRIDRQIDSLSLNLTPGYLGIH